MLFSFFFFFSSRRRHTRYIGDWSSDVCSSDLFITRKMEFSASHICANPALPEEENRRLFGDAANPHGHGHNYVVEVTVRSEERRVGKECRTRGGAEG